MSFGFSVGDFFAVGQLAWSVYKSCKYLQRNGYRGREADCNETSGKSAGGAFAEVSHEGESSANASNSSIIVAC
jgi:hypothetical protein